MAAVEALRMLDVQRSPATDFISQRERALRADGARREARPTTDDFLKRLDAVEDDPRVAALLMPLVSRRAAPHYPMITPIDTRLAAFAEDDEISPDQKKRKPFAHKAPLFPRYALSRRVHKEAGTALGLSLMDHPKTTTGVVVQGMADGGACFTHGVRVGDHILKINDTSPANHQHAMRMIEDVWKSDAELKFSIAERNEELIIRGVGGEGGPSATWPSEDLGITLIDNTTAGVGVVVLHAAEGLPAARSGLQVGHVIQSVAGQLAMDHKSTLKLLHSELQAHGVVRPPR